METEFQVEGKICFKQELYKIITQQDVYNKLRDYGFYDLEVIELKEKK